MSSSKRRVVINTGPLPALVAGTGALDVLRNLFEEVIVPLEVQQEIGAGTVDFGKKELRDAAFLRKPAERASLSRYLDNTLDPGEASVIQTEIDRGIETVCIDEAVGRRIARLHRLQITGSIGVLIAAKRQGMDLSVRESIVSMKKAGIWLTDRVVSHALKLANEPPL